MICVQAGALSSEHGWWTGQQHSHKAYDLTPQHVNCSQKPWHGVQLGNTPFSQTSRTLAPSRGGNPRLYNTDTGLTDSVAASLGANHASSHMLPLGHLLRLLSHQDADE